ncbi:MAG: hypothetical protein K8W52_43355 [Deltaproteobacteria bacterium]|nr:hypothetical protein [Deltaproteobacteria bacterium]
MRWAMALMVAGACGSPTVAPDAPSPACKGQSFMTEAALGTLPGIYLTSTGSLFARPLQVDGAPGGFRIGLGRDFATLQLGNTPLAIEGDAVVARTGDATDGTVITLDQLEDDCAFAGTQRICTAGTCVDSPIAGQRFALAAEAEASGMSLVGEIPGNLGDDWRGAPVTRLRVADSLALVTTDWGGGLRIVDVADPAHPVEVAHVAPELPELYEGYVDVRPLPAGGRRYALVASDRFGVVVVDVTAPASAAIVGHVGLSRWATSLAVRGTTAYVAAYAGEVEMLEVWDVADPLHPVARSAVAIAPGSRLEVDGDHVYAGGGDTGLTIIDVANPDAPVVRSRYQHAGPRADAAVSVTTVGAQRIAVVSDARWAGTVQLVDVTDDRAPHELASWQTRSPIAPGGVIAVGSRAFVADDQDGVRVLDLADPRAPQSVGWFHTWSAADPRTGSFFEGAIDVDVDVARGLVYVLDNVSGLVILHLDL